MGRKIDRNVESAQPETPPVAPPDTTAPEVMVEASTKPVDAPAKTAKPKASSRPTKPVATAADTEIEAIVGGYHGAPYDILGPHAVTIEGKPGVAVRAFRPLDKRVDVLNLADGTRTSMKQVHPGGFFEAVFPLCTDVFPYRLVMLGGDDQEYELEDPYHFPFQLTEFDLYLHGEGTKKWAPT